jgi:hypothetical protein
MSPKQKDRTTTTKFKNLVLSKSIYLVFHCVQKGGESSISKMVYQNPLEHQEVDLF